MGIETAPISAGTTRKTEGGGAESGALPAELAQVVAAWPTLPDAIRAAIQALVRAAGGDRGA